MAPIPPFLNPGEHGQVEISCSGSSGQLLRFSCSYCFFLSDSPPLYPCQKKTTAAPSPTTLPDRSIPCSDTPTALLLSEASTRPRTSAGSKRGSRPKATPGCPRRRGLGRGPHTAASVLPTLCVKEEKEKPLDMDSKQQEANKHVIGTVSFDTLSLNTKEIRDIEGSLDP